MYRKCLSFAKNNAQAEDLTHDIFLKLVITLGSFKEQAKFSTWLYAITYNYCADYARANNKNREVCVDDGWERMDLSTDDGLAEMEAQQLKNTMEKMPFDEQTMLLMKYQDDISIRDIAEVHGLTESAVKMPLKRSRDKLRKYYLESAVFWLLVVLKTVFSIRWPLPLGMVLHRKT